MKPRPSASPAVPAARLKEAESRLSYRFKKSALLAQALCHASTRNDGHESNERLEFLGDAVLGMLTSWFLFEGLQTENEGGLSRRKAQLTSGTALAAIAQRLELGELLITGKGQETTPTANMEEDLVEAIIGAIFLDGGLKAAQDFVMREILTVKEPEPQNFDDPKSMLQNHTLRLRLGLPEYRDVESSGPAHSLTFTVDVHVQGIAIGRGSGSSKKLASQEAARNALDSLLASEDSKGEDAATEVAKKEAAATASPAKPTDESPTKARAKKASKKASSKKAPSKKAGAKKSVS